MPGRTWESAELRGSLALLLFISAFSGIASAGSGAQLLISSSTAPAGSVAQIQVYLAAPQSLVQGELTVDLDPAVFGPVAAASVFSATGDAMGYASLDGRRVNIGFRSASGGIGQIAGNPIVVLNVPILTGLAPGTRAAITATSGGLPWMDRDRNTLPVSVTPGAVTVGGALSVRSVQPGSGLLPTGTVIRMDGTGFNPAATVDIQAAVATAAYVSPTQFDLTLAGPAEISGKRIRIRNPDGEQLDYFPAWAGGVLSTSPDDAFFNTFPILPLQAWRQAITYAFRVNSGWLVLQNPNADAVDVSLELFLGNASVTGQTLVRIAPGGYSYQSLAALGVPLENSLRVLASAPVRIVELSVYTNYFTVPPYVAQKGTSGVMPLDLGPLRVEADRGSDSPSWIWQTGTAKPAAQSFHVRAPYRERSAAFTVSVATASGAKWLSAAPSDGRTCATPGSSCTDPEITVSVDPTGLAPGIYRGSITLNPTPTSVSPDVVPTIVPVSLTVIAAPLVSNVVQFSATFVKPGPPNYTPSQTYNLTRDLFPGGFSIAVHSESGGNWLAATASSATAPAVLTVSGDLNSLAPGRYAGEVVVTGSGNTLVIPVMAFIYGGLQLSADYPLRFSARAGDPSPPAQIASVTPQCQYCPDPSVPASIPFAAFVKTNGGGGWLSALPSIKSLSASVNSGGLAPGVYTGVITLTANALSGATQIPVVLTVWSGSAPGLSASPSSAFSVWYGAGSSAGYFCVSAGSAPVTLDARAITADGGDWLKVTLTVPVTPTCGLNVALDASKLAPGTYNGRIVVSIPDQSLSIPVSFYVPPPASPVLGSVVNAASAIQGAIAPGEIVTIYGMGIGPQTTVAGRIATNLSGAQVFLDDTPAQLISASASQVNAIVPYDVAGRSTLKVQVSYNGSAMSWTLPVATAAPGIFTLDSSGAGPAAVLNQDNSINSPSNPAAPGSVLQIFATGINVPNSGGPISVSVGGVDAAIQYAGPAPAAIAGLYQINAVVPAGVAPGVAVPLQFAAGSLQSQGGVTIAVK